MESNRINIVWICLVAVYTFFHVFLLSEPVGRPLIEDEGLFSYLTMIFVAVSIGFTIYAAKNCKPVGLKVSVYALCYVMFIYLLREADFHRLFTDEHVTRIKFYSNNDTDFVIKVMGGAPLLFFLICAVFVLYKFTRPLLHGIISMYPWAIALLLWGITIVLSQLIDKSFLNKIYPGRVVEEMLELCAAGYMLLAAWTLGRKQTLVKIGKKTKY